MQNIDAKEVSFKQNNTITPQLLYQEVHFQ